jgi:hypothetical protein
VQGKLKIKTLLIGEPWGSGDKGYSELIWRLNGGRAENQRESGCSAQKAKEPQQAEALL